MYPTRGEYNRKVGMTLEGNRTLESGAAKEAAINSMQLFEMLLDSVKPDVSDTTPTLD